MIWGRIDQCHWRCEDYKDGYAIEVKPHGKKSWQYHVFFNDKKIKSGRQPHPCTAMDVGTAFVDKHLEE